MAIRQIIMNIPEKVLLAEKADESSFARELRLLAAIKLYELGRLSSGRAAELAGIPRVEPGRLGSVEKPNLWGHVKPQGHIHARWCLISFSRLHMVTGNMLSHLVSFVGFHEFNPTCLKPG